jgi:DNA-binding MarR family transcriptional regulator
MTTEGTRSVTTKEIQGLLRDLIGRLQQLNDVVGSRVDLNPGDVEVLDLVARYGPLSTGDVGRSMGIHPATLTGVVDRLEQGGWLQRVPDPHDRRKVRLEARRERGGELARLYAPMNRSLSEICGALTPGQLRVVRDFLRDVGAAGVSATESLRRD